MTYGIIDIGSNTVRLNIYQIKDKNYVLLLSKKEAIGLVAYVQKKKLTQEGIEVLVNCLSEFKSLLEDLHVDGYSAFATASLRGIKNADKVVDSVKKECNMDIEILSGSREGELSYFGAMAAMDFKEGLYIDSGGGSTELVSFKSDKMHFIESIPYGSLNLFDTYVDLLIPTKKEKKSVQEAVKESLKPISDEIQTKNIVITGGSMRAIRKLLIKKKIIKKEDTKFKAEVLHQFVEQLDEMSKAEKIHLMLKVKPDRIHTMLTGLYLLDTIVEESHAQNIQVSLHGIREGYLIRQVLETDYES